MLYACSKIRSFIRLKLMFLFFYFAIFSDVNEIVSVWRTCTCILIFLFGFFPSCVVTPFACTCMRAVMSIVSCLPVAFAVYFAYPNGEMLWHVNMCRCVCVHQVCFSILWHHSNSRLCWFWRRVCVSCMCRVCVLNL